MNATRLMGAEDERIGPGLEKAPTGIPGLDQITGGGLPCGRVSLVAGAAGAGKTLLGLEFLVGGARKYGEPGVLVSFEESAEKVALNVRSPGFDLDQLGRDGLRFVVLPITSIALDYAASQKRLSTGVGRLDQMLGGGVFRGSTTLVTGMAGTGKTSLAAHMVHAACERGERALWILFDESPAQVLRNMRSLGLDLQPLIDAGLLRIWAARPSAYGLKAHLAALAQLVEEVTPSVVVLDGIGGLAAGVTGSEAGSMVARQLDLLKSRGTSTMATSLGREDEPSTVRMSSLVDNWLLLRNVETNGERNRLLFVLKSRGTAHSNQVREFVLTDHGVELVEVYVGAAGMLAGSARLAQQAVERDADLRKADDLERHLRDLRSSISEREAHLIAVRDKLIAERSEIDRIDRRERREVADTEADRVTMASRRWADAAPGNGGKK